MTLLGPTKDPGVLGDVTIREAREDDAAAVQHLAVLDSSRAPRGTVLIGEVAGVPWAAVSVEDLHAVSDPFRPAAELVWLLLARARQVRREQLKRQRTHARRRGARRTQRPWTPAPPALTA